tara:strand:- start:653 stop:913 length:261 start_codon:yes stop_codon:yes gene_type:complete
MPIYEYHCLDCDGKFNVFHSMDGSWDICELCESENIQKVVAGISNKIDKTKFKVKTGDLVKSHIENTKAEVKKERSRLKNKVYKDD